MNAHDVLGVTAKSSKAEIKKAWRRLSQKFHPDRNPKGEAEYKLVQEAYTFLTTGVHQTGIFKKKQKPKPAVSPFPDYVPPTPNYDIPAYDTPHLIVDIGYEHMFKSEFVGIPGTRFVCRVPQGVTRGHEELQRCVSNDGATWDVYVTFNIIDKTGFYTVQPLEGKMFLYCEIKVPIATMLAGKTLYLRNINPLVGDVGVMLDITKNMYKIEHAGLPNPARGSRDPLYVHVKPQFISIAATPYDDLVQLRSAINSKINQNEHNSTRYR